MTKHFKPSKYTNFLAALDSVCIFFAAYAALSQAWVIMVILIIGSFGFGVFQNGSLAADYAKYRAEIEGNHDDN